MSNPSTPRRLKLLPDWRRQPGSSRNYENVRTGEVLSRRQYDNKYGRIARTGFHSEYQQKKAEKNAWKGFYSEHFKVKNGMVDRSFRQLVTRITELGHRRMFVSAHGEAGSDYPLQAGAKIWVSTLGFYGDAQVRFAPGSVIATGMPGLHGVNDLAEWIWWQFATSALLGDTIDEFVLRWKNE